MKEKISLGSLGALAYIIYAYSSFGRKFYSHFILYFIASNDVTMAGSTILKVRGPKILRKIPQYQIYVTQSLEVEL